MKLVAEFEKNLTPLDEKTNVALPFIIADDFDFLRFTASYSPKRLTDRERAKELILLNLTRDNGNEKDTEKWESFLPLVNLVTLSLDDEKGYRGACHRQAEYQELLLSESEASPGLLQGKITKGKWKAVLNVHALVTENCTYKLKIEGGDKNEL